MIFAVLEQWLLQLRETGSSFVFIIFSYTISPRSRPTSVPTGILIHPTVWPQYTNVTDRIDRTDNVKFFGQPCKHACGLSGRSAARQSLRAPVNGLKPRQLHTRSGMVRHIVAKTTPHAAEIKTRLITVSGPCRMLTLPDYSACSITTVPMPINKFQRGYRMA